MIESFETSHLHIPQCSRSMMLSSYIKRRLFGLRWRWEKLNNKLFDWRHGMNTHQKCLLYTQGVRDDQAREGNNVYRPFWRKEFSSAMGSLGINFSNYLFVDVGSGKGKMLLLASHFPFPEIIGIEYAPGLHAVALKNIQGLRTKTGTRTNIVSINADALTWDLPNRPTVYFLYNPFDLAITKAFFAKLGQHAERTRTANLMIYGNVRGVAEREEAFSSPRSLRLKLKTPRYFIHISAS